MKKKLRFWLRIWFLMQLLLTTGGLASPVFAHTEDAVVQMSLEPIGPYAMTVWTYPGTMRAGSVHYTVALLDTAVSRPLDNATVTITAVPLEGQSAPITGVALQGMDAAAPAYYELDLTLSEKGTYRIEVQVTDRFGETWLKDFQVEVVSATFIKWVTLFLLVQSFGIALWLMRESVQTWGLNRLFASNAADWEKTRTRTRRSI